MTDKVQKIREKVEKLMYGFNLEADIASCEDAETEKLADIKYQLCKKILDYIDEVQKEPVSEDLKKAAEDYGIRQGAELKPFAIKYFKAGAQWQKEQMMTKSIEAVVSQVPCSNEIILYNPSSVDKYYLPQEMNKLGLNKGDKVKLVIIKEG